MPITPSPTITLFSEHTESSRRPATLLASAMIHGAVIALVSFGIFYAPQVSVVSTNRYTFRHIDLHAPDRAAMRAARGVPYPGPRKSGPQNVSSRSHGLHSPFAGGSSTSHPAALRVKVDAPRGPQTLVQPDLAASLASREEAEVPQLIVWTPSKVVVKKIVAPEPEQPTAAASKPSLDAPNQEVNLSDVDLASSDLPTAKLQVMPSTTSPIEIDQPELAQLPPTTVSQVAEQPTPAAVVSLSDLRMKDGTATLPPIRESAGVNAPGVLAPTHNTATQGAAGAASQGNGSGTSATGAGASAAEPGGAATGVAGPVAVAAAAAIPEQGSLPEGSPAGAASGLPQGSSAGADIGDRITSTDITLPKNGDFGAVVVGDAVQDEFPEMAGVWSGRMAYTVYLHVGASRSWILQYSLPASADAAAAGNLDRVAAPWPYNIVRPNLPPGAVDADAIMVHGFVDSAGHFESLSIVFPQLLPEAQFVLASLERWQFRPASQNGQPATVEVLLIIPEELD